MDPTDYKTPYLKFAAECIIRTANLYLTVNDFERFLLILRLGNTGAIRPIVAQYMIKNLVSKVDISLEADISHYFAYAEYTREQSWKEMLVQ